MLDMLMSNGVIFTKLGVALNACELMHTTTINTLNDIRLHISKTIEKLESKDEWVSESIDQVKLNTLKNQKELVNLIIGYKRFLAEQNEIKEQKEKLTKELNALKESQKSPEDRIKELEDKLSSLDTKEFN
jgi:chromatin segregation and condensation protein Rec8/ScpA/Scc1 (kleisin family)